MLAGLPQLGVYSNQAWYSFPQGCDSEGEDRYSASSRAKVTHLVCFRVAKEGGRREQASDGMSKELINSSCNKY